MKQVQTICLEQLPATLPAVSVKHGETIIRLSCDIVDIFEWFTHNLSSAITEQPSNADVFYVTPSQYPEFLANEEDYVVDFIHNRIVYAGQEHYGKMKSLVSAMESTCQASQYRQGIHACAFTINKRGKLLLGNAYSGKSYIFLNLLQFCDSVVTDDWCDVVLEKDGTVSAICLESNMSVNCEDIDKFINQKMLPSFTRNLPSIRHGFRDKVVFPLFQLGKNTKQQISIEDIYFLADSNYYKISLNPTAEELERIFTRVSKHLPLCDLIDCNYPFEKIADVNQKNKIQAMCQARKMFFQSLANSIRDGKIHFYLLPYQKDDNMLKSVVDIIRK